MFEGGGGWLLWSFVLLGSKSYKCSCCAAEAHSCFATGLRSSCNSSVHTCCVAGQCCWGCGSCGIVGDVFGRGFGGFHLVVGHGVHSF